MEIGKMLNEIRNVLAPQIPAQQAQPNAALAHIGDSFRSVLNPDSAVRPLPPQQEEPDLWGTPKVKWGYNDDKVYYTDNEMDPRWDEWTDYLVIDNNTGKRHQIQVGTTIDPKLGKNTIGTGYYHESTGGDSISSVKELVNGKWVEHKGVDDISKFFRENFDMDAGDYSVLRKEPAELPKEFNGSVPPTYDPSAGDKWWVEYDKKTSNLPFIPSQIFIRGNSGNLGMQGKRRTFTESELSSVLSPLPDTKYTSVTDLLKFYNTPRPVSPLEVNPKWWKGKEDVTPVGKIVDDAARMRAYADQHPNYWMQWDPSTYEGGYYKGRA